jgi:hypothetical protein
MEVSSEFEPTRRTFLGGIPHARLPGAFPDALHSIIGGTGLPHKEEIK